MTKRHVVPDTECPVCSMVLNRSSEINGKDIKPTEGDVTICNYCSCVMVLNSDLKPRVITDQELKDLKENYPNEWKTIEMFIHEILH